MTNDDIKMGETIAAILQNVETGEKRVIDNNTAPKTEAKYKIEVKMTNLQTGAITRHEEIR